MMELENNKVPNENSPKIEYDGIDLEEGTFF